MSTVCTTPPHPTSYPPPYPTLLHPTPPEPTLPYPTPYHAMLHHPPHTTSESILHHITAWYRLSIPSQPSPAQLSPAQPIPPHPIRSDPNPTHPIPHHPLPSHPIPNCLHLVLVPPIWSPNFPYTATRRAVVGGCGALARSHTALVSSSMDDSLKADCQWRF